MNCIVQYVPRRQLCYIKFNWKFTHVSSCLIVKNVAETVFRCAETIKKTSSANINTVAHRQTRSSAIAVIADRTACSILTLFIVIATPRPLNKKNSFAVSPRIQQLLRICVRNPQSAHVCWTCSRTVWPFTAPCHCWQTSRAFSTPSLSPIDTYGVSHRFLWCILWLNDTYYSKSVWSNE